VVQVVEFFFLFFLEVQMDGSARKMETQSNSGIVQGTSNPGTEFKGGQFESGDTTQHWG
jgi:hypothetical protein